MVATRYPATRYPRTGNRRRRPGLRHPDRPRADTAPSPSILPVMSVSTNFTEIISLVDSLSGPLVSSTAKLARMSTGTGEDQAASAPAAPEPAGGGPALPRAARQHPGRRRNAAARDAILDVTFELLRTRGTVGLTIDAIAEAAGVGRQTIYRWWPGKGAVAAEAMARGARAIASAHDTGSFADDLERFLADSFAGLQDQGTRRALRQLVSAAQGDEHVAEVLTEFTAQRRAALRALLERGRARGDIPAT